MWADKQTVLYIHVFSQNTNLEMNMVPPCLIIIHFCCCCFDCNGVWFPRSTLQNRQQPIVKTWLNRSMTSWFIVVIFWGSMRRHVRSFHVHRGLQICLFWCARWHRSKIVVSCHWKLTVCSSFGGNDFTGFSSCKHKGISSWTLTRRSLITIQYSMQFVGCQ
jgi:hypothetical protein